MASLEGIENFEEMHLLQWPGMAAVINRIVNQ